MDNTNVIEMIKQYQDTAAELFTFGELSAILNTEGELSEKLALAFTLGYIRGAEKGEEA